MLKRNVLYRTARLLWPALEDMPEARQVVGVGNVIFFLYTLPPAVLGIIWLAAVSDWRSSAARWPEFLLIGLLMLGFSRLNFFTIVEIHPGTYANADSSLSGVIIWTGILLLGPEILWLPLVGKLSELAYQLWRARTAASRWVHLRTATLYAAAVVFAGLASLQAYRNWGGRIPLSGLEVGDILPAFGAIGVHVALYLLVYAGFIVYIVWAQGILTATQSRRRVIFFFGLALGMPFLAYPFGILAAGLYTQNDLFSFLFFVTGLAIVAVLARRLSRVAENSRQQHRQLVQLELLSREIISGSPDGVELPAFLQRHVPIMFPSARVIAWVEPDNFLLRHPPDWYPAVESFWDWMVAERATRAYAADVPLPWREVQSSHNPIIVAPILEAETGAPVGFIYTELQPLVQPWNPRTLAALFPGINALAAQIASARSQAEVYEGAVQLERTAQELEFASEIQASFLPDKIPILPGWELAVTIIPAREMAGDFFDIIPLENGQLGILIADVTDKGIGPSLYMALSRTLIRTYAIEFEFEPDTVLFAANRRILADARARLFVTAFYAVLDPESGTLTYANAGHNPPYLLRSDTGEIDSLTVTGMPIGIEEDAFWEKRQLTLLPGDVLLLYTDGIPDAYNEEGEHFGEDQFTDIAHLNARAPAHEIQAAVIDELQRFVGAAPPFDDITLMVLKRDDLVDGLPD